MHDGDRTRIDLERRTVNMFISHEKLQQRRKDLGDQGYNMVLSGTPWQELFRQEVAQLSDGMVLRKVPKYQRLAQQEDGPRHNN